MSVQNEITIDGRQGEGGGQVLRSSLALSLCTGQPLQIENIRAGRRKPGLMRQHLACAKAAMTISGGTATGARLGSVGLEFCPGVVRAGDYRFAVGSAGSVALVMQTVLVPLLRAEGSSTVRIEGGTHSSWAPPFDFLEQSFLPVLNRWLESSDAKVEIELERAGFYPAGGGAVVVRVHPGRLGRALGSAKTEPCDDDGRPTHGPLSLTERGAELGHFVMLRRAHLPVDIVDREWSALQRAMRWDASRRRDMDHAESTGPGNSIHVSLQFENVTEVISSFGAKGRGAKSVAGEAAAAAHRYLNASAPVGCYLADQLLLPMALLGGGEFRTLKPTKHLRTNVDIIHSFLPGSVTLTENGDDDWSVSVRG